MFDPRAQRWAEHFRYEGPIVVGLTGVGRATIAALLMNDDDPVAVRRALIDEGVFRPAEP